MEIKKSTTTNKFKKIIIILIIILVVVFLFFQLYFFAYHDNYLKYPGNGIPHFSKNKAVKNINNEMTDFFSQQESFLFEKESAEFSNIFFDNILSDIKFQSNLKLVGPETMLRFNIRVNSGKADIFIGDVEYVITPSEAVILQNGNEIYKEDRGNFIKGISIWKKGNNNPVASIVLGGGSYGKDVNFSFPASISIELKKGSSGIIGQWEWQRGFE